MGKQSLMLIVFAALIALQAAAVKNYQRCFQCFHEFRQGYGFCGDTGECLPVNEEDKCDDEWIERYFDCPNEYDEFNCSNFTFTKDSFK